MIRKKPKRSYIREQLINEIWYDIRKMEKELIKLKMALTLVQMDKFNTDIKDYTKVVWYVSIKVPVTLGDYKDYMNKCLFIHKITGKNEHEK